MRKILKRSPIVFLFFVLIFNMGMITASASVYEVSLQGEYRQSGARTMLKKINEFRSGKDAWYWNEDNSQKIRCTNLKPLVYDYELEKAAMQRAMEIAIYFEHVRPNGQMCDTANENIVGFMGENILMGTHIALVDQALESWKETNESYNGQGHRRNMLSADYKAVGIGHAVVNGVHYWTQEFSTEVTSKIKTSAVNGLKWTDMEIHPALIAKKSIRCSTSSLEIGVGKSTSFPKVTGRVKINWIYLGSDIFSVDPKVTWSVSDPEIAQVSNGKVIGLKGGQTTLIGRALGKTVKVTLNVIAPPKTPVLKKIYNVDNKHLKITWARDSYADGYIIYRAQGDGKWKKIKTIGRWSALSFTDTTVKKGVKYKYTVCAYKKVNGSILKSGYDKTGLTRIAGKS